jgi:hypothetical protein
METAMANDSDWVEDVRRWCGRTSRASDTAPTESGTDFGYELGYEAANPSVQAAYWPDTPTTVKEPPR